MNIKDKIKQKLTLSHDDKLRLTYYTAGVVIGISAYTYACGRAGYRMVAPVGITEDKVIVARGISGLIYTSPTTEIPASS